MLRQLSILLLLPHVCLLASCGGGTTDVADGGGESGGAQTTDTATEPRRMISVKIDGEAFEVDGDRWASEVRYGSRDVNLNFASDFDPNAYMGDALHLAVMSKSVEEGTLELVRHRQHVDQLADGKARLQITVDGRPDFENLESQSGSVTYTRLRSNTEGKRFTITELEGTFDGQFTGAGNKTYRIEGSFAYRL